MDAPERTENSAEPMEEVPADPTYVAALELANEEIALLSKALAEHGLPATGSCSCEYFEQKFRRLFDQPDNRTAEKVAVIHQSIGKTYDILVAVWDRKCKIPAAADGASRTPSSAASVRSAISDAAAGQSATPTSKKRPSSEIAPSDAQANISKTLEAIASGAGTPFRPGASLRQDAEVSILFPLLGKANFSLHEILKAFDTFFAELFPVENGSVIKADLDAIRTALNSANVDTDATLNALLPLRQLLIDTKELTQRMYNLFALATRTDGCSWLTVQQLLYRECYDVEQAIFNPELHRPLVTWEEKVREAAKACKQDSAFAKDGALRGPIAPAVAAALSRGRGQPWGSPKAPVGGGESSHAARQRGRPFNSGKTPGSHPSRWKGGWKPGRGRGSPGKAQKEKAADAASVPPSSGGKSGP